MTYSKHQDYQKANSDGDDCGNGLIDKRKERGLHKIVVAADSFKGSATSAEVAEAIRNGILAATDRCEVICTELGDGGEGTAGVLTNVLHGHWQTCHVEGPLGQPLEATYGIANHHTAIIEIASAAGLMLLPCNKRNPLKTSTYGVGQMMSDALRRGCRNFMICLGGSATNDGGMGMLQALDYKFYDGDGELLGRGGEQLHRVVEIDASNRLEELSEATFTVACDVRNPFYGPEGAARVFARQKGADEAMIEALDRGMRHFAEVVRRSTGTDLQRIPGAGAAGGLGGALVAFLGAQLRSGVDVVLDAIDFDHILTGASLVVTGEGRIDNQTLMGKAPAGVMRRAARFGIPVVAIGGSVDPAAVEALNQAGFDCVLPTPPYLATLAEAMDKAFTLSNISRTASQIVRLLSAFGQ